jgi:hypothetical protein
MNIPEPNEYAKAHGHNPFPPRWEKWLSAARQAILTSQPQAGRHVSIDEHPGKGTVINIDDTSARRPTGGGPITGACCIGEECSITTEAACTEAGGTYQGDDTDCDPNPCITPECPSNVHVAVCFEWYPVGVGFDCVVNINEEVDIPLFVYDCPIDFTTTGNKIQEFTGNVTATPSGSFCASHDFTGANVNSHVDLFWDASLLQWTIDFAVNFPHYPATFTYGPTIVAGEDLTSAGLIVISSDSCPSGGTPNPSAAITIEFS